MTLYASSRIVLPDYYTKYDRFTFPGCDVSFLPEIIPMAGLKIYELRRSNLTFFKTQPKRRIIQFFPSLNISYYRINIITTNCRVQFLRIAVGILVNSTKFKM